MGHYRIDRVETLDLLDLVIEGQSNLSCRLPVVDRMIEYREIEGKSGLIASDLHIPLIYPPPWNVPLVSLQFYGHQSLMHLLSFDIQPLMIPIERNRKGGERRSQTRHRERKREV